MPVTTKIIAMIILFAVLAFAALFMIFIAGKYAVETWPIFKMFIHQIKEWATMITGILAVSAALYTVRQMKVTDEKQAERHNDLMSLNLDRDRLRLQRAIMPVLDNTRRALLELEFLFSVPARMEEPNLEFITKVGKAMAELVGSLEENDLSTVVDMFDADLNDRFNEIRDEHRRTMSDVQGLLGSCTHRVRAPLGSGVRFIKEVKPQAAATLNGASAKFTVLRVEIVAFLQILERLAWKFERYAIR